MERRERTRASRREPESEPGHRTASYRLPVANPMVVIARALRAAWSTRASLYTHMAIFWDGEDQGAVEFPQVPDGMGDPILDSPAAFVPELYEELRRVAHQYMRRERTGHTLQTTALVNEAYLRLAGVDQ